MSSCVCLSPAFGIYYTVLKLKEESPWYYQWLLWFFFSRKTQVFPWMHKLVLCFGNVGELFYITGQHLFCGHFKLLPVVTAAAATLDRKPCCCHLPLHRWYQMWWCDVQYIVRLVEQTFHAPCWKPTMNHVLKYITVCCSQYWCDFM